MDAQSIQELAVAVSSPDLATSREAARDLKDLLQPESLLQAFQSLEKRELFELLLQQTAAAGNTDVYSVVGECLERALQSNACGTQLLSADSSHSISNFLIDAVASEDVSLATRVLPAVHALLKVTLDSKEPGQMIGEMMNAKLSAERTLRLFDCDAVESDTNFGVYQFLKRHTELVSRVFSATIDAFDTDPLLLANYLVVSGIICQREPLPAELAQRVHTVLDAHDEDINLAFVCRFCSIALYHREENAANHAADWVAAALAPGLRAACSDDTLDAVFDLLGSAATSASGWQAILPILPLEWISAELQSRSAARRIAALRLTAALLQSPYFDPSAAAWRHILQDAWKLRTALDEGERRCVWEVCRATVASPALREQWGASYATFLCGGLREDRVEIRELQLVVARALSSAETLPDATKQALERVKFRGLYPAGSAGVAELPKD